MAWIKVLPEEQLPDGKRRVVWSGGRGVLIIHARGKLWACQSSCPHMAFPLEFAKVDANDTIICALHHSAFDLRSGDVKDWSPWPPGIGPLFRYVSRRKALKVFPVKREAGHIWIDA